MALINGIEYSYAQITMLIGGVPVTGVAAINYDDDQEKMHNYGLGKAPVSRSYGKYTAKADVTLHASEVEGFTKVAPNRDILQIPPFDIIVTVLAVQGQAGFVHKIRNCEFTNNSREMKEGDQRFDVKLNLIVEKIDW